MQITQSVFGPENTKGRQAMALHKVFVGHVNLLPVPHIANFAVKFHKGGIQLSVGCGRQLCPCGTSIQESRQHQALEKDQTPLNWNGLVEKDC